MAAPISMTDRNCVATIMTLTDLINPFRFFSSCRQHCKTLYKIDKRLLNSQLIPKNSYCTVEPVLPIREFCNTSRNLPIFAGYNVLSDADPAYEARELKMLTS